METLPVGRNREKRVSIEQRITALRQMTAEQLLNLGKPEFVYLKARLSEGDLIFVLYAADGAPILSADDLEQAAEAAAELGLEFITVH
jgi:hypothetical protein